MTSQRKRKAKLNRQMKETIKKRRQAAASAASIEPTSQTTSAIDDVVSLDKQQLAIVLAEIKDNILSGIADGITEEFRAASPSMQRKIDNNASLIKEFLVGLREGIETEIADYIEKSGDKISVSLADLSDNFTKALDPLMKGEGIIKEALRSQTTNNSNTTINGDESNTTINGDESNTTTTTTTTEPTTPSPVDPNERFARKGSTEAYEATDRVADLAVKARETPTTKGLGFGTKASIFMQDVLANTVGLEDTGLYKKVKEYQLRKEHYIKNEGDIRSEEFEGMTESEKRKSLEAEFKSEDKKVKEMTDVNEQVEEMRAKGYDENAIALTKAGSRRQELAGELANSPSSRFNDPYFKEPPKATITENVTPSSTVVNSSAQPSQPVNDSEKQVAPKLSLSLSSEEAQNEALAEDASDDEIQKEQASSLKNIDKNTSELKESIEGLKVSMKEAAEASSNGGGGLDIDLPSTGRDRGGKRRTPKGSGGKIAGGLSKVAPYGSKLIGAAKGGLLGLGVGLGADYVADKLGRETKGGAAVDTLGTAATWASTGAMIGSVVPGVGTGIGAAVGGVAGAAKGLYDNWGSFFGEKDSSGVTAPTALPTNVASMQSTGTSGTSSVTGELPRETKKFAEELGKNIVVRVPPPTVIPSKDDAKIIEPSFTNRIKNNEPSISDYLRTRYAAS